MICESRSDAKRDFLANSIRFALQAIGNAPYNLNRTSKWNRAQIDMEHLRVEIWDLIYRSGPQSREQIAESLSINLETVATVVQHEWFDISDSKVQIATGKPPTSATGLVG